MTSTRARLLPAPEWRRGAFFFWVSLSSSGFLSRGTNDFAAARRIADEVTRFNARDECQVTSEEFSLTSLAVYRHSSLVPCIE